MILRYAKAKSITDLQFDLNLELSPFVQITPIYRLFKLCNPGNSVYTFEIYHLCGKGIMKNDV